MEWVIIVAIIPLIIAAFIIGRLFASKPIEDNNNKIRKQLDELITDINIKKAEQQKLKIEIQNNQEKNQWIENQYQEKLKVIENTKQLADEELKQRKKVLEYEFEQYKIKQEEIKQNIQNEIQNIQNNLESLKSTKAAAIKAARKEQEIQENKSFYTLQIPREEKRDIEILEDTKMRISKPRAIAMIIWTAYYQQIAKVKFPKILGRQDVCGVYKITNLITGECYIGQSKDVRKRWYEHMKAACGIDTPAGNKLYAAMQAEGIENFSFELLEECLPQDLDKKEKYFIELYHSDTLGYNGTKGNG